jgi:hypothetical protein
MNGTGRDDNSCAETVPTEDLMRGVYFVTDGSAIKIGFSVDATQRLPNLQTATPRDLRLIASFPGSEDDEASLHAHFCHLKIRGEWFTADEELLTFIADLERGRPLLQHRPAVITDAISGKLQELTRIREVTWTYYESHKGYLKWFEEQKAKGFFGDPEFERLATFGKLDLDVMCGGRGGFKWIPVFAREAAANFAALEAYKSTKMRR